MKKHPTTRKKPMTDRELAALIAQAQAQPGLADLLAFARESQELGAIIQEDAQQRIVIGISSATDIAPPR